MISFGDRQNVMRKLVKIVCVNIVVKIYKILIENLTMYTYFRCFIYSEDHVGT